jgi:hypothetical protein
VQEERHAPGDVVDLQRELGAERGLVLELVRKEILPVEWQDNRFSLLPWKNEKSL